MIPASGQKLNELFIATPLHREVRIRITQIMPGWSVARGEPLARALGGRWSDHYRAWTLTPARADKWFALWSEGFTARRDTRLGAWRFWRADVGGVSLGEAMKMTAAITFHL